MHSRRQGVLGSEQTGCTSLGFGGDFTKPGCVVTVGVDVAMMHPEYAGGMLNKGKVGVRGGVRSCEACPLLLKEST